MAVPLIRALRSQTIQGGLKIIKKGSQSLKKGFAQKFKDFKVPKLVCRSPLDHFEAAPTLFQAAQPHFAIFGRACDIWPR